MLLGLIRDGYTDDVGVLHRVRCHVATGASIKDFKKAFGVCRSRIQRILRWSPG